MITFLAPDVPAPAPRAGERLVRALPELIAAAYSRLPEHADARANVVALNHQSLRIAQSLAPALPDDLQEFWEAYTGWFAMYSVAPLLANMTVARQLLAQSDAEPARVLEHWQGRAWWSGRESLQAAIGAVWTEAGRPCTAHPGVALRALRRAVALRLAVEQGRRELAEMERLAAAGPATIAPCDILWLAVGGSSVDMIVRLQELLHVHGRPIGILDYDYFGSRQGLDRAQLPYAPLTTFLRPDDFRQARGWQPRLVGELTLPPEAGLGPAQQQAIADRLRLVLARDAAPWRLRALASHRALDACTPRVVVGFHTYGPVMAPTVIAAQRRGLPRLCLQHGVIGPRYLALPCLPYDEKLVFGDYARDIMRQASPDLRVTVTGHALHDAGLTPPVPSADVLALREGVNGLVVLCTQFNEQMYYRAEHWWMEAVAEACRRLGARLVLKLHPSDSPGNIALYRTLLREGDDRVVLVPHGQLRLDELLVACDLMITRDSTVVFEANLFDRPVVTINLSDHDEELPYAGTGGGRGVTRYEDIAPTIEAVLRDGEVRQDLARQRPGFLAAHTGPGDGQATARIVGIIEQWADGTRPPADQS